MKSLILSLAFLFASLAGQSASAIAPPTPGICCENGAWLPSFNSQPNCAPPPRTWVPIPSGMTTGSSTAGSMTTSAAGTVAMSADAARKICCSVKPTPRGCDTSGSDTKPSPTPHEEHVRACCKPSPNYPGASCSGYTSLFECRQHNPQCMFDNAKLCSHEGRPTPTPAATPTGTGTTGTGTGEAPCAGGVPFVPGACNPPSVPMGNWCCPKTDTGGTGTNAGGCVGGKPFTAAGCVAPLIHIGNQCCPG